MLGNYGAMGTDVTRAIYRHRDLGFDKAEAITYLMELLLTPSADLCGGHVQLQLMRQKFVRRMFTGKKNSYRSWFCN